MLHNEGRRTCDKEIKSRDGLWKGCRRPATVRTQSKTVARLELDYCCRHAPKESLNLGVA